MQGRVVRADQLGEFDKPVPAPPDSTLAAHGSEVEVVAVPADVAVPSHHASEVGLLVFVLRGRSQPLPTPPT